MNAPTIPPTRVTQPSILSASTLVSSFQNELEDCPPYLDFIAMMEDLMPNRSSIQKRPIGTMEVLQHEAPVFSFNAGMPARDRRVLDDHVVVSGSPEVGSRGVTSVLLAFVFPCDQDQLGNHPLGGPFCTGTAAGWNLSGLVAEGLVILSCQNALFLLHKI
jgi:hypothetical protein